MNVLFISYWYPSVKNPLKGVFVKKHAQAIKTTNTEIRVLSLVLLPSKTLYKKNVSEYHDEAGIQNHQIVIESKFYKLLHLMLFYQTYLIKKEYKRITLNFKPDLIHANVLYPAAIWGYFLSKKHNIPYIITEHWSKVDHFMKRSAYASIGKKTYNNAKSITVVSEFLRSSLLKYTTPDKIKIVPNVVNNSVFKFKNKPANENVLVFTIVAHWSKPKRPDLIFESLEFLSKNTQKNIELNVIGEGHLMNELKNRTWNYRVNYLGNIKPDDIAATLQASDFFLHASDIETFSIVIAEALSTGTPVLASNKGAIPELINETNGLLAENTVESWSTQIKKLTETHFNNEAIANSGKRFGFEKTGSLFKDIYEKILKN